MESRIAKAMLPLTLLCSFALMFAPAASAQLQASSSPATEQAFYGARHQLATNGQSATFLPDGRWLLLGGEREGRVVADGRIVDPATNQSLPLQNPMLHARSGHTATVLPDGSVIVIGGIGSDGNVVGAVERLDLASGRFVEVPFGLSGRVEHTATLLTDGRLLVVGGLGPDGVVVSDVEVLDTQRGTVDRFDARMETERFGHLAALLPSAPVLVWGGLDRANTPATQPELFLPDTQRFAPVDARTQSLLPDADSASAIPVVTGVHPDPAGDVALDATLGLRFSKPMDPTTLNSSTVTLIGPNGIIPANVVAAESGMLLFVTPRQDLNPLATYTLFVSGAKHASAQTMPLTAQAFRTGSATRAGMDVVRASSQSADTGGLPGADAGRAQQPSSLPLTIADRPVITQSSDQGRWTDVPPELPKAAVACGADPNEAWKPDITAIAKTGWVTQRAAPVAAKRLVRVADEGVTAVAGVVLRLNGLPLANVIVSSGGQATRTDAHGVFLLTGLRPGSNTLNFDGADAGCAGVEYGNYDIHVDLAPNATTILPYDVWMSKLDIANARTIAAPTASEVVLTHPQLPGLEVRIPAGTLIRDRNGRIVTRVSITPVPNDRPPYPMPEIAEFPVYFTLQPGGARLEGLDGRPRQARVIYPNYTNVEPDRSFTFWSYDAGGREWQPYGVGTVSADAKAINPADGVGLYLFSGFSVAPNPNPPPCKSVCCGGGPGGPGGPGGGPGGGGGGPSGGDGPGSPGSPMVADPCNMSTGQFSLGATDFQLSDVVPLALRRVYFSGDNRAREFGYGMMAGLQMYIYNPTPGVWDTLWMVTSSGGRIVYTCTSGCGGYSTAQYEAQSDPGYFFKSTIQFIAGTGWQVTTLDGTKYLFYNINGFLQSITDRYGNTTTYEHAVASGSVTRVVSPNGR